VQCGFQARVLGLVTIAATLVGEDNVDRYGFRLRGGDLLERFGENGANLAHAPTLAQSLFVYRHYDRLFGKIRDRGVMSVIRSYA